MAGDSNDAAHGNTFPTSAANDEKVLGDGSDDTVRRDPSSAPEVAEEDAPLTKEERAFVDWVRAGRAASDIGLDWGRLFAELRDASALREQGKREAEAIFALQKQELEQVATAARAEQEHQREVNSYELERVRMKAQLDYSNDRTRGIVLYLVVAALVLMPIFAMTNWGVSAEQFAQYVAPVTGIAGTILGYWFGQGGDKR
ncbi:hypothetical protein [Streptomyces sp. NPDC020951]|uniref:hypothetical protein n=1 Tax=Streptomyces sp. NPDC020951 TaxID=3365104 RepID=UPI003795A8F7